MDDGWASPRLHLIGSSPALLNRPADWPAHYHLTGFLALPPHDHEALSPQVEAFLSRGPAPVFMGFGSLMPMAGNAHLDESIAVFKEAARLAGQRAIIQADVDHPPADDLLFVRRTPHAQVFPRCAAIVHHAGAGTTHTTLRAGVPSVPVPHVSDQFAWSEELERLGVAPRALRRNTWSAARLAERIRQATGNPRMKAAAVAIQQRMAADDGPSRAAELIVERNL
jgi:UDP:flavonoid glycosyltransferase YjiC (YdhE family)